MDGVPGPRNILTKGDPSFTPGDLAPIPWPKVATPSDKAEATKKAEDEKVGIDAKVDANPSSDVAVADIVKANVDATMAAKSTTNNPADISNDPAYAVDKMVLETPMVSAASPKLSEAAEAKTAAALVVAVAEKPAKDAKAAADAAAAKAAEVAADAKSAEKKVAIAEKEKKEDTEIAKGAEAIAKGDAAPPAKPAEPVAEAADPNLAEEKAPEKKAAKPAAF